MITDECLTWLEYIWEFQAKIELRNVVNIIVTSHITVAQADESSQATEESNQEDDTIFRRYQRQEQERQRFRRDIAHSGQEPSSDQLGWSIFSLLTIPSIGIAALIFSGLSNKSRIQGRVWQRYEPSAMTKIRHIIYRQTFDHLKKQESSIEEFFFQSDCLSLKLGLKWVPGPKKWL